MVRSSNDIMKETKYDPEVVERINAAREFLMLHGKALLNDTNLRDPGGALCGKMKKPKSTK